MKKFIAVLMLAVLLAGCKGEKVAAQTAPEITQEQVKQGNENIGKSIPLPTTMEIPEKGKYKY